MVIKVNIKNEDITRLEIFSFLNDTTIEKLLQETISNYLTIKEKELFESLDVEQKENYAFLLLMKQSDRTQHIDKTDIKEILKNITD